MFSTSTTNPYYNPYRKSKKSVLCWTHQGQTSLACHKSTWASVFTLWVTGRSPLLIIWKQIQSQTRPIKNILENDMRRCIAHFILMKLNLFFIAKVCKESNESPCIKIFKIIFKTIISVTVNKKYSLGYIPVDYGAPSSGPSAWGDARLPCPQREAMDGPF